jgi:hemerythrin-like domain-containing protein
MTNQNEPSSAGNPTQDLRNEHHGIQLMLSVMGQVSARLKKAEDIPQDHLKRIHEFLKTFADRCHHGKEEDILFPELKKNPQNLPLLNQLLGEHMSGRDLIRGMGESLPNYLPGSAHAVHIAVNMDAYISLLARHINLENGKLFSLVEKEFPQKMMDDLAERFERLEREVIGVGRHEEFHRWLEEFKGIYLD